MRNRAEEVHFSTAMFSTRFGGKVRCYFPAEKRYRYVAPVDAIDHIDRGSAVLAVNAMGGEINFDPETGQPVGSMNAGPQQSPFALTQYTLGELRMMCQEVGISHHSMSVTDIVEKLKAHGYHPTWLPEDRRRELERAGEEAKTIAEAETQA